MTTEAQHGMGPFPAVPGCLCQICEPVEGYDAMEWRCLVNVLEHGWHVMGVGAGEGPGEPAFAYTLGLQHRVGHPELVISGLDVGLMHRVLNVVAQRVMDGLRLVPGQGLEQSSAEVVLLVEALSAEGRAETVTWAQWFHRRPVGAVATGVARPRRRVRVAARRAGGRCPLAPRP